MRMYDIIKNKREGGELSKNEIEFFIKNYTGGSIPDYQASALLMAIFFKGMSSRETLDLTLAMLNSGDKVNLSMVKGATADKHSTGGVGDKTTLLVAPIVAACGVKVPKMSGRGLGHTGGTVDKLESITGYRSELSEKDFIRITNEVGLSIIGQTKGLVPADKKLYALRDATATVESLPLIVSSIMSKKLAVGGDSIVLDVKVGRGSFNKTSQQAKALASEMVKVGKGAGKKVVAVITNMDNPLGRAIGNSLEVIEAVETLQGRGKSPDLKELSLTLSAHMLSLSGKGTYKECLSMAESAIKEGTAFGIFLEMVKAHGGDISLLKDTSKFPKAGYNQKIISKSEGYITQMDTEKLGNVSLILGGGRIKKEDKIDHSAGIILGKKTGDYVKIGDTLAILYTNKKESLELAKKEFLEGITLDITPPPSYHLIMDIIK